MLVSTVAPLWLQTPRGVYIAATSASANASLVHSGDVLLVQNVGDSTVYVEVGFDSATAAVAPPAASVSYPLLPGEKEEMYVPGDVDVWVAAVTSTGITGSVVAHRGYRRVTQ